MRTLSAAVEDYLKAIYEVQLENDSAPASTSALADKLGVARASVTGMLKKLAATEPTLVEYRPYYGVSLTGAGEKIALEVIRHHRLIEAYLTDALGFSWDQVHFEADELEHVISEELESRIADYLGHPSVDPHGHPIPSKEGSFASAAEAPLTSLEVGEGGYVSRVSDRDSEALRYLAQLGLKLNAAVEVTEKAPFDGPIHVRIVKQDEVHALSRRLTDEIFVAPEKRETGRSGAKR